MRVPPPVVNLNGKRGLRHKQDGVGIAFGCAAKIDSAVGAPAPVEGVDTEAVGGCKVRVPPPVVSFVAGEVGEKVACPMQPET